MSSELTADPGRSRGAIIAELTAVLRDSGASISNIEVDSVGSPVSVPAADWFVCFVPGLRKQWWHRFANAKHQHVFAIRRVHDARWLLVEPWWTRMLVSVLTLDEALKFLRWGATGDILQVREATPGRGNQAHGWSNCAVLIGFLLGRSYWTWTPHGLYRRLSAESGVRPVDLAQWLTAAADSPATTASFNASPVSSRASKERRARSPHVRQPVHRKRVGLSRELTGTSLDRTQGVIT